MSLRIKQKAMFMALLISIGFASLFFAHPKAEQPDKEFQALNEYLAGKALANEFSGVVMIAKDGKVLLEKTYGYADKNFSVPNKINTKFNLGSLNKMITIVAATQLMQQGKLKIDDKIGKYLDGFAKDAAEKVTIRHLIQMKSGWGDYWDNEYYTQNHTRMRKVSDYLEMIKKMPLQFEPGTNQVHSNSGFIVLGAIIEKITGMDYFDYVRENIYRPAGMTDSDSYDRDSDVSNIATGYTNFHPADPDKKGYKWSDRCLLRAKGMPDGGGYSTAPDLLKFDLALRSNKFLNEKYTKYLNNMFEGELDAPLLMPDKMRFSAGGSMGVSTLLGRDLKDSYTVIVLSNYDMQQGNDLIKEIRKALGK
jgi:D-alanyl-D-alanine carboxypeptidase